jgi:SAM-dependent methyltransferase
LSIRVNSCPFAVSFFVLFAPFCGYSLVMQRISLNDGRHLFGNDPTAYAEARPDYPDALFQRLITRCGLRPGTSVFEIGPGTGIATRRLLSLGASPLRAIEPDPRLAAFLRGTSETSSLEIDQVSFDESALPEAGFDLGVAATSFHWLEQSSSLAKVHRSLKPGGWWAMWWNQFGSEEPDDFQRATDHLFAGTADSPSWSREKRIPFGLDRESRLQDLNAAGFKNSEIELWSSSLTCDTARLVALYSTFSPIQALEPEPRREFLSDLARIADEQFGGRVERALVTVLYSGQRGAS